MSCDKRFLFLHWQHHDWVRRVSATDDHTSRHSDIWGGTVTTRYVTCHVEHVCRSCGKTRDDGECSCDELQAQRCSARLAFVHGTEARA